MTDDKDHPITATDFICGVKVVDIGEARVSRGLSRRPHATCRHQRMIYDDSERRIWCEDCQKNVEPYEAFTVLVENYSRANSALYRQRDELETARKENLARLAARKLDDVWRQHSLIPKCPHCSTGLLPDDFMNGISKMSKEIEIQRRKRDQEKKP